MVYQQIVSFLIIDRNFRRNSLINRFLVEVVANKSAADFEIPNRPWLFYTNKA